MCSNSCELLEPFKGAGLQPDVSSWELLTVWEPSVCTKATQMVPWFLCCHPLLLPRLALAQGQCHREGKNAAGCAHLTCRPARIENSRKKPEQHTSPSAKLNSRELCLTAPWQPSFTKVMLSRSTGKQIPNILGHITPVTKETQILCSFMGFYLSS